MADFKNMFVEIDEAIHMVSQLKDVSSEMLNKRLGEDQWSIAECLHHIITTNTTYFKQFDRIIKGRKEDTLWESINPFTENFSKWLLKSAGRTVGKKMKTPSAFKPTFSSDFSVNVVDEFIQHQEVLKNYYKKFQAVKVEQFVITSPASGFITPYLDYALMILTAHQLRHLDQALRIKSSL